MAEKLFELTSAENLSSLCDQLIGSWRTAAQGGEFKPRAGTHIPQLATVHGLAAHSHRIAGAADTLMKSGQSLEARPLVRLAYETAITAHWAAQTRDGSEALMNEMNRQRTNTARVMRETSVTTFRQGADVVDRSGEPKFSTSSGQSGRIFEQRCNDLTPCGADGYVYYRIMSEMCHASIAVLDEYLDEREGAQFVMRLDPRHDGDRAMWTFFLAASLCWAGRAVDYFDRVHRRRSELRDAARKLQISLELQLSDAARQREAAGAKLRGQHH